MTGTYFKQELSIVQYWLLLCSYNLRTASANAYFLLFLYFACIIFSTAGILKLKCAGRLFAQIKIAVPVISLLLMLWPAGYSYIFKCAFR